MRLKPLRAVSEQSFSSLVDTKIITLDIRHKEGHALHTQVVVKVIVQKLRCVQ